MVKKILTILLVAAFTVCIPVLGYAESSIEVIDIDNQNIAVSVTGNVLHVSGANGEMLHIYNVAGVRVMSLKIEGADKSYELNLKKGCYIVKVGKVVRKISIK